MQRFFIILLVLVCSPVFAQAPLGLQEAVELALKHNLQIQKQQQAQKLADLEVAIREGQRLPSLDFVATSSYTNEIAKFDLPQALTGGRLVQVELGGHDRTDVALTVRQPLYTGARLKNQVRLAQKALESESIRLRLLNQLTSFQVNTLFYRAQNLKREQSIQAASLERLASQLAQTRNMFQAAQALAFDTLQVFNQTLQLGIQMDQNRKDQRLLDLQMARLLDLPETRPITEIDLRQPAGFRLSLDSLQQVALAHRSELQIIGMGQQTVQLQKKLAEASFQPVVNAEASYNIAKPGLNQVANDWMNFFRAGVQVQWNLWRGNQDRHRVEQAEVEFNRLALEERELVRQIRYEVEQGWENVRFAVKQIELAGQLLAQQQERFRIVSTQHGQGVVTTNDVVVAETDLRQAELQMQRSIVQYYLAETELLLATGAMTGE